MHSEEFGASASLRVRRLVTVVASSTVALAFLGGCAGSGQGAAPVASTVAPVAASSAAPIERKELQVGRTTPVTAEQIASDSDVELARRLIVATVSVGEWQGAETLVRRGLGGVAFLGSTREMSKQDVEQKMASVRAAADTTNRGVGSRTWIVNDEEGGGVQRLQAITGDQPSAKTLSGMSPREVRRVARGYGQQLKAAGVDVVFAPVADVGTTGWIGRENRTFGDDPAQVAKLAHAWAAGMSDAGIATTAKHWPGHGGVQQDSHDELAVTEPWNALQQVETAAFTPLFEAGIPLVMVGHLRVPGLTEGGLPATLSSNALAALRKQAGPETIIITDNVGMGAITALGFSQPEAAVKALESGADMVVASGTEVPQVVQAIVQAMQDGRLPREQVVDSALRIANAKAEEAP